MVLTRRGSALKMEANERESLKVVKKRKQYTPKRVHNKKGNLQFPEGHVFNYPYYQQSPLSQIQLTYSGPRNLVSDVLKHHHNSALQTSECKISMVARRAIENDKFKEAHNTESNFTYVQCLKDEIQTMNHEPSPYPIPGIADVATFGNDYMALNMNTQEEGPSMTVNNNSQPTESLNMTEFIEINGDDEEVSSLACNNNVTVRGYEIKPQYVDIFSSIFSKYGDIAIYSSDKPEFIRSSYVEFPCFVLDKLAQTEFSDLTTNDLKKWLQMLTYLEGEKVYVGWLKNRVEEIHEAKLSVSEYRSSKQSLENKQEKMKKLKEELEIYDRDYNIKISELADLEEKIRVTRKAFADLEKKIRVTRKAFSEERDEVKATKAKISKDKAKVKSVIELKSLSQGLI